MLGYSYLEIGAATSLSYFLTLVVYRLFFHPLAKFPGPKLAALTTWYEGYYDVIKSKGRFTWELARLHDRYGELFWSRSLAALDMCKRNKDYQCEQSVPVSIQMQT
jgi:hypothetical protein